MPNLGLRMAMWTATPLGLMSDHFFNSNGRSEKVICTDPWSRLFDQIRVTRKVPWLRSTLVTSTPFDRLTLSASRMSSGVSSIDR
jgi:hypothetical protein